MDKTTPRFTLIGCDVNTPILWRIGWLGLSAVSPDGLSIEGRLCDEPRPGAPGWINPEQVCRIVAVACGATSQSGTSRVIADETVKRGFWDSIAPRHAARVLKSGTSNRT